MTVNPISRNSWGARPPKMGVLRHRPLAAVTTIHVHHTATPAPTSMDDAEQQLRSIQADHMDVKGWADIGYHFVIAGPMVYECRPVDVVGAETMGHNDNSVGVAFMRQDDPVSLADIDIFNTLAEQLAAQTGNALQVRPHSADYPTDCPGEHLRHAIGGGLLTAHQPPPGPPQAPTDQGDSEDMAPTDVVGRLDHRDGLTPGQVMTLTRDGGVQLHGFAEGAPVPTYTAIARTGETYTFPYQEDGETVISYPGLAQAHHDDPPRVFDGGQGMFFLGSPE